MDEQTYQNLLKYLAVKIASDTIAQTVLRHLLERERPGFKARYDQAFETLWNDKRATQIRYAYADLSRPDRSLSAEDMTLASE